MVSSLFYTDHTYTIVISELFIYDHITHVYYIAELNPIVRLYNNSKVNDFRVE